MIKPSQFIIGIITFLLITFWVEPAFVAWLVNLLPASVDGYKAFLKVVFWIIVFFSGLGISILVSVLVATFLGMFFKN